MSQHKLAGKTAIVTGAGAGIGQAIAEAFAGEGAAVVCADVSVADAQRVADGISASGGRAAACLCDVADPEQASAAVARAVEEYGGLHVLVSNAAVFTPVSPVEELSLEDWQQALAVNLTGAFLMSKYAIPRMRNSGGGSVIFLASQLARVAVAGQAAYCATKGALVQLAKTMALDHCDENIRVNTLSPGGIATGRVARRFGDMETARKIWGPAHPMGRLGEPQEIARGAVFLAGEDSSFMTGADLLIDGGFTAR